MEEEKKREDWWLQDKIDAVWWGVVFLWGALVLLAETTGFAEDYSWWDGWGVFFTGAGGITLIGTIIRLQMPAYRAKWVGGMIFGLILLAIGLGTWAVWGWLWILVLFIVGIIILREAFVRKR